MPAMRRTTALLPDDLHEAAAGRIFIHPVTQLEIASTDLRNIIASGRDPRYLMPDAVRDMADLRVRIPMAAGFRSLNIAVSTGIAVAEALRQTGQFPT